MSKLRRAVSATVATAALMAGGVIAASPASAATYSPWGPIQMNDGYCYDVPGSNAYVGAQIIEYSCNGQDNQQWQAVWVDSTHFELRSGINSGLCLNNWEGGDGLNNHIKLYNCANSPDGTFNFVHLSGSVETELQPRSAISMCNAGSGYSGAQITLSWCGDGPAEALAAFPGGV